jgi:hypothetical protein
LLIAEFAIVHDLAHGRHGLWRDFNQVKLSFFRHAQGIVAGDNTHLIAFGIDQAQFTSGNFSIQARFVVFLFARLGC